MLVFMSCRALRAWCQAVTVLVLCAVTAGAAAPAPEEKASTPKVASPSPAVAVINIQRVVSECVPGKALMTPWREYITSRQGEFQKRMMEQRDLQGRLEDREKPVKAEEKLLIEKRLAVLEKELNDIRTEAEAKGEIMQTGRDQIENELERLIKELCRERGVVMYFDITPPRRQQGGIPGLPEPEPPRLPVLVDPSADLTEELIARLVNFKITEKPSVPAAVEGSDNPMVVIETSLGEITVELDAGRAPATVANFLKYVDAEHYNGTIFHRVIKDFMIQGGGLDAKMKERPTGQPVRNEAGNGLPNVRGSLAMARTSDPDSATAQFYINHVDNEALNRKPGSAGYTVFGRVVSGLEVVDKIAGVKTGTAPNGMENVPTEPVTITSVRRLAKPVAKPQNKEPATKNK